MKKESDWFMSASIGTFMFLCFLLIYSRKSSAYAVYQLLNTSFSATHPHRFFFFFVFNNAASKSTILSLLCTLILFVSTSEIGPQPGFHDSQGTLFLNCSYFSKLQTSLDDICGRKVRLDCLSYSKQKKLKDVYS